jgi:hypothetical protein
MSSPTQGHRCCEKGAHRPLGACAKGERWQLARCLLAVMQETDLVPNVNTYSAAIGAARRCTTAAGTGLSGGDAGSWFGRPMILIEKRVISACAEGVQWRQALCLLAVRQENDSAPNVITHSAAIGAVRGVRYGCGHLAFWR